MLLPCEIVEEARIIKQVKDDLQGEMLATLNEFKMAFCYRVRKLLNALDKVFLCFPHS